VRRNQCEDKKAKVVLFDRYERLAVIDIEGLSVSQSARQPSEKHAFTFTRHAQVTVAGNQIGHFRRTNNSL